MRRMGSEGYLDKVVTKQELESAARYARRLWMEEAAV